MGCCPCFKKSIKVSDTVSSNLVHQQSSIQPPKYTIQVTSPNQTIQIESLPPINQNNNTEHNFKPQAPAQMQSNLQISLSASAQNQQVGQSNGYEPHIAPKMVLLCHSKIRESVIYRWEFPEFKVDQLFLPVNYDALFKQINSPEVPVCT